jgi:class 3 adenylate cyclase/tetratricopeptide (TPR) repeat protein
MSVLQRKTVTVLFCDVTGSTAMTESSDPEAMRALLARYFERMKGILESHGASVEKFIGDAVMAVFGVPQVHEDDALRACRAAIEMRDALPELGLQARIGLDTGEVVTGSEERLATGDVVNVAARLEQAAQPGTVLIGEETLGLVHDAVAAEEVEALELKGKAEPVAAYRLLDVHDAPERVHESVFVGRSLELETLRQAWERVLVEERCELVTVTGTAGVGKSRLAAELIASIDARAVRGRCLSYGEGITYFPVVDVLKQLDTLPSDAAAAAALRSLLGESGTSTSADEIAWAFRKLLEEQAPVVCIFDDVQWGEETFLDLIEHVGLLSSAPILLLCLARPDLADRRPEWSVSLRLDPLPDAEAGRLIPESVPADLRSRIAHAAGGNPLFLTEMAAMAGGTGADVLVPPNLQALLAARLDQLQGPERAVLERGAVEGEIFHRGAVQTLSEDGTVVPRLAGLVRKELIRPDRTQLPGDDAFRFRHLLIRDAAYDAVPKSTRAELHERFADWLEARGADLVELDEILGFHLEQAARYKAELGRADHELAARAGERLAAAGRRALVRADRPTAVSLLQRSLELTRPWSFDVHLEIDLSDAHWSSHEAGAIADAAAERARELGDRTAEALARVVASEARVHFSSDPDIGELERDCREALPLLERAGDDLGLARVWHSLGFGVLNLAGRLGEWAEAAERAIEHWRRAGRTPMALGGLPTALLYGPRPVDEALRVLDQFTPPGRMDVSADLRRAGMFAMLGRFDEAWAIVLPAAERAREHHGNNSGDFALGEVAALSGDHEAAVEWFGRACDAFEARGSRALLSSYAPKLGRSLCELDRYDEADRLAELGRELGDERDYVTQMYWRQVKALVAAHRGEHAEAERLAREAVQVTEATDALNDQGDSYYYLGRVLAEARRTDEAAEALEQALDRYERKKNLAMVAQVRPRLEGLLLQLQQ